MADGKENIGLEVEKPGDAPQEKKMRLVKDSKQSVKKLMSHGVATNSIELYGYTKIFDRVPRNGM